MKVLALGASGPIGQAVMRVFPNLGFMPRAASRITTPSVNVLEAGSEGFLQNQPFDAMLYLVNPNPSELNDKTIQLHTEAFRRWLDAAEAENISTVLLLSSSAVYGVRNHKSVFDESSPVFATNHYTKLKLQLEALLSAHLGIRTRIAARVFNVFGPGCDAYLINRAAKGIGPIWNSGEFARDYLHVDDIAKALGLLLQHAPSGFGIWNVASGVATTNAEIVAALPPKIAVSVAQPYDSATSWSQADSSKLHATTGFVPYYQPITYLCAELEVISADR